MNKRLPLILWLIMLLISSVISQDLKELMLIGKAKILNNERVARRDYNGNYCAAIQIISDIDGFTYDSNDGIIGLIDDKPGLDMVYLKSSERLLKIFHKNYTPLQLNLSEYGISLKPGGIWQLTIADENEAKVLPVTIRYIPNDAKLIVDGEATIASLHYLSIGEHTIKISKPGYFPVEETLNIDEQTVFFEWQLNRDPNTTTTNTIADDLKINPDPNTIEMVFVKGGTFTMGCTSEQNDCAEEEKPAHEIILNDFYISKYEVTQSRWQEVMETNEKNAGCPDCPVANVSWDEVNKFLKKIKKKTGKKYCLPTEAEWEYAARGGHFSTQVNGDNINQFAGSYNIDEVAWYTQNAQHATHAVGSKKANELGIYDMSGNVWEWCEDRHSINYYSHSPKKSPKGPSAWPNRVLRGGSWDSYLWYCRVASRKGYAPIHTNGTIGFRLALPK